MEFDLDQALALLSQTPKVLTAWLGDLPREWIQNNEGPETWGPTDQVGPWKVYLSILKDRQAS